MSGKNNDFWGAVGETVRFVVITLIIVVPFRLYVAQPFIVSGDSMVPTFHNGEYLIVDELSYNLRDPERGEVIVFRYPKDTSKYFIKRVIGLPEEKIEVSRDEVRVEDKEGKSVKLSESYIRGLSLLETTFSLSEEEYFVLGDNRAASSDSRVWGAVKREHIVGRAFLRLLPVANAEVLPGNVKPQIIK